MTAREEYRQERKCFYTIFYIWNEVGYPVSWYYPLKIHVDVT